MDATCHPRLGGADQREAGVAGIHCHQIETDKNMKIKSYISALRLRSVPLSLAGVSLGAMLAAADYHIDWKVIIFLMLTAVCLQVLSNVSNELGDFQHGTVSAQGREASQSLVTGDLTEGDMKLLIKIIIVLTLASGLAMLYTAFGTLFCTESLLLMVLGYFAIRAAMKYTMGKNPYGYRGLGDLFVFIFFGLVAVLGAYSICTKVFPPLLIFLPAVSIGTFSIAVLNVNNLRDMESDRLTRTTVAIRLGERGAKIYQTVLIATGWVTMLVYASLRFFDPWHFLFILTLPLYIWHLTGVWKKSGRDLDRYLPMLVLSTFAFAILGGLGFLVYLM